MQNFKEQLKAKAPLLGTFIKTPHPHNTEVLSHVGLSTLCLDAEHAPFDRSDLDMCVLAAKANQQHVIVRVENDKHDTILNALDLGADGILVPHVKTAKQLESVISHCYYGAKGRGYAGSTRMAGYTTKSIAENLEKNLNQTTVIAQIEDLEAMDDLEQICQTPQLDCLFIGRMDLTVALDETDAKSPKILELVDKIVETANKYNVTTGMFIGDFNELDGWLKKNVSLFLLGSDHSFMLAGARQLKQKFEEAAK